MMPRGFKPVGWVAAVGGAALGCYMLSLNVASERAELGKIEHRIMIAKTEIRALNTELGTRGRLQQLEHWNAEVLALSAPTANQFVENEVMLARFETREKTIGEQVKVQMASASSTAAPPAAAASPPKAAIGKKLTPADYAAAADRAAAQPRPMLRLAAADTQAKASVVKAATEKAPARTAELAKAEVVKAAAEKAPAKPAELTKAEPKKGGEIVKSAEKATAAKPASKPVEAAAKAEAKAEPRKKPEAAKATRTAAAEKKPEAPAKAKAQGGAGGQ